MAKKKFKIKDKLVKKNFGSGGTHEHYFSGEQTELDGRHSHMFVVGGIPFMTAYDGAHSHPVNAIANRTGPEDQKHKHKVRIAGIDLTTMDSPVHLHELAGSDYTTNSGLHRHVLVLDDGTEVQSLLPGDLLQAQVRKRVALEIQSVHVSNLLFPDEQQAIQFIEDRDFIGRDIEKLEDGFKFRQLSRSRFKEETLREIELSNGVKALVGILDPDKMSDAHKTLDSFKDIDPTEDMLKEEQILSLARLQDIYAEMVTEMKTKAENFIPVLNQFVDLSDEFMKNDAFQVFLTEFIDSFNVLNDDLMKIDNLDVPAPTEKSKGNFEDHIRSIEPVLKGLADAFENSEGFPNFGRLLRYNQLLFKQMILNLPIIRSEGTGTPIAKVYNDFIDLEKMSEEEFEHLSMDDLKSLKLIEIDTEKLKNSEVVNDALTGLLKKLAPEGDVNVSLGSQSEQDGWINIGKQHFEGINVCYNLDKGVPLPISSVNKLKSTNFLQKMESNSREMIISEISRILKNGGTAELEVPSTDGQNAFLPCYKSLWNKEVFKYCCEQHNLQILESSTDISEDRSSAIVKVILKRVDRES